MIKKYNIIRSFLNTGPHHILAGIHCYTDPCKFLIRAFFLPYSFQSICDYPMWIPLLHPFCFFSILQHMSLSGMSLTPLPVSCRSATLPRSARRSSRSTLPSHRVGLAPIAPHTRTFRTSTSPAHASCHWTISPRNGIHPARAPPSLLSHSHSIVPRNNALAPNRTLLIHTSRPPPIPLCNIFHLA